MVYTPVGWANDTTHPLSQANMKTLDAGVLAAHDPLDVAEVTSGTAATLTLTVPAGVTSARVVGTGRTDETALRSFLRVGVNSINSTNAYRYHRRSWSGDTTTPAVTVDSQATFWAIGSCLAAASASTSEFGSLDLFFPTVAGDARKRVQWAASVFPTATTADFVTVEGSGRVIGAATITTIVLSTPTAAFVAGTRYELRYA